MRIQKVVGNRQTRTLSYVNVQLRLWRNAILNIRPEIIRLEFIQKYKSTKSKKYKWKNCDQEVITSVYVSRINGHNSILLRCTCSALMQSNANADCKSSFEVMANRICTDSKILLHWLYRPLYAFTYGKNNKVSEKQYPGNFSVIQLDPILGYSARPRLLLALLA